MTDTIDIQLLVACFYASSWQQYIKILIFFQNPYVRGADFQFGFDLQYLTFFGISL